MCLNSSRTNTPSEPRGNSLELSAIVVSWNTQDMTVKCIESLVETFTKNKISFEIILVDNASEDNTVEIVIERFPETKIIQLSANLGFARAVNKGIFTACGNIIMLINSDIILPDQGFTSLISILENNPECGITGPSLYPDDNFTNIELSSFTSYPNGWNFIWDILIGFRLRNLSKPAYPATICQKTCKVGNHLKTQTVPIKVAALSGAFLCIKKTLFDEIGYFDEQFYFYFEDIDFCERAVHNGFDIIYNPEVRAIHLHNGTVRHRNDRDELFFNSFYYYLKKRNRMMSVYVIKVLRKVLSIMSGGKTYG